MKIPLNKLAGLGETTTPEGPNWFQRNWEALTGIGIGVVALIILLWISLRKPKRRSAAMGFISMRRKPSPPTKRRSPAKRKAAPKRKTTAKRRRKTANATSGTKRKTTKRRSPAKRKPATKRKTTRKARV